MQGRRFYVVKIKSRRTYACVVARLDATARGRKHSFSATLRDSQRLACNVFHNCVHRLGMHTMPMLGIRLAHCGDVLAGVPAICLANRYSNLL